MRSKVAIFASLTMLVAQFVSAQIAISPRAFGWRTWREPVANAAALPSSGNRSGDCRVLLDGAGIRCWVSGAWATIGGGDDTTCLSDSVTCNFAASATEGGAATTALELASDPAPCPAGEFVTDVDAAASLTCAAPNGGGSGSFNPAGVAGGQNITGGTGSGESLELRSTAHATKGTIRIMDEPRFPSVKNWIGLTLGSSTCSNGNCPDGVVLYTATDGSSFPTLKLRAPNGAQNVIFEVGALVLPDGSTPMSYIDSGRVAVASSGFFGISQFDSANPGNSDSRIYRESPGVFAIRKMDGITNGGLKLGFLDLAPIDAPPTCVTGRVYSDLSGALCWCDGSSWVKVVGSGTCS